MDLYKLKYFHSVAENKSFSTAAKKCLVTQSAMSQAVGQLEKSLNATLFQRAGKELYLTERGEILYQHTQTIFSSIEAAKSEMASLGTEMVGKVTFATNCNIGNYLLLKLVKKWLTTYPKVKLAMKLNTKEENLLLLKEKVVDFIIVPDPPKHSFYESIKIFEDSWTVVCSMHHPLSLKKTIQFSDLSSVQLLIPYQSSPRQKDIARDFFEKNGVSADILLEANDSETLKQMVIHNLGVAILPKRMIQKEIKTKILKDLNIKELLIPHDISILYLKNKKPTFIVQRLINFFSENLLHKKSF